MANTGDIFFCTITQTGSWGAYATADSGDEVFINFGELSWHRLQNTADVVSVGERVKVLICCEPQENRPAFLGSIKRAAPGDDPWTNAAFADGSVHDANVIRVGTDIAFLALLGGVIVALPTKNPSTLSIGQNVKIRLKRVDVEARTALADLVELE